MEYARRAPNRDHTTWVRIKIEHMTVLDAVYWDRTIQPDIFRIGWDERRRGEPVSRADMYWSWTGLRVLLPLAQDINGRRCRALSVFVENDRGKGVPAGMMLLIEQYPWLFAADSISQSTFAWFMSSAPAITLQRLGIGNPPSLGRVMIDAALVTSEALGMKGQMWLHAARPGGQKLMEFYEEGCKLLHLRHTGLRGAPLPGGKVSDGRHFYSTAALANRLTNELQLTRQER